MPEGEEARPRSHDGVPERLGGSLFVDVTTITVDPAYVEAAARRADGAPPHPGARLASVVALAALGLLLAAAANETSAAKPAAALVRGRLVAEASRRTAETDALQRAEELLRADAAAARDRALRASRTGDLMADSLGTLELVAGDVAVRGPALEVNLADAPGDEDDGRIRDRDLQDVVNALFASGAEAIGVNGQRVSALTAIREAGEAILVDYRPISGPYVVQAIGDAQRLESAFAATATFRTFRSWTDVYGLGFTVRRRDAVTLPAVSTTRLRHARATS